jgi:hypothetical protein
MRSLSKKKNIGNEQDKVKEIITVVNNAGDFERKQTHYFPPTLQ